jgi:ATP-binding cassette subfamily F protein uup
VPSKPAKSKKKLSYKLRRELDALPDTIAELEDKIVELTEQTSAAGFYDQEFSVTEPILNSVAATQEALDTATERWIELEELQESN